MLCDFTFKWEMEDTIRELRKANRRLEKQVERLTLENKSLKEQVSDNSWKEDQNSQHRMGL